jgi:hypothetical protein
MEALIESPTNRDLTAERNPSKKEKREIIKSPAKNSTVLDGDIISNSVPKRSVTLHAREAMARVPRIVSTAQEKSPRS